jgi:hypothetical protein
MHKVDRTPKSWYYCESCEKIFDGFDIYLYKLTVDLYEFYPSRPTRVDGCYDYVHYSPIVCKPKDGKFYVLGPKDAFRVHENDSWGHAYGYFSEYWDNASKWNAQKAAYYMILTEPEKYI